MSAVSGPFSEQTNTFVLIKKNTQKETNIIFFDFFVLNLLKNSKKFNQKL